jgi:hypothetical protein
MEEDIWGRRSSRWLGIWGYGGRRPWPVGWREEKARGKEKKRRKNKKKWKEKRKKERKKIGKIKINYLILKKMSDNKNRMGYLYEI